MCNGRLILIALLAELEPIECPEDGVSQQQGRQVNRLVGTQHDEKCPLIVLGAVV